MKSVNSEAENEMQVSATEFKNNMGKYLSMAGKRDIYIAEKGVASQLPGGEFSVEKVEGSAMGAKVKIANNK